MKLIASPTSPFSRKVRIVAAEKHIEYELVVDAPWESDSKVSDYNPLGKVPVWVFEDGKTLFDSRVIVEYLDSVSPVGHLIPTDPRARIAVKRCEALADGIVDAAVLTYLERKRPEVQQSQDWIDHQLGKVRAGLAAMSHEMGMANWCVGDSYTLADIATGCALGYLDFRFPELDWRRSQPHLSEYFDRIVQRPTFKDTVPVA
ncbi:glutathione S-transferase [Parasulfuritortus cantonensis]|uniref:Glutathione S-transferase n=2 Tax=Parasulfuritortus cantonensis TaxID=2528202 RepID=A0A4R1BRG5_9PROT|nr:glutathione S-transferase [Parasulfuritortus cantonensis]TCJ19785.1 glutathione S-transferase [Parasulfuritortus cantonensis]